MTPKNPNVPIQYSQESYINLYIYIYIYTYRYRERGREKERDEATYASGLECGHMPVPGVKKKGCPQPQTLIRACPL